MKHRLNDITLYYPDSKRKNKFTPKQNLVSDLYIRFLEGYKPPKTTRISVDLSNETDSIIGFFGSILVAKAQFNKEEFWNLSDHGQNLMILKTIHRIALICCSKYEWNKEIFEKSYNKVIQSKFLYAFEHKRKHSKSRKFKAALYVQKDEICTTISVTFYDKLDRKIKTIELFKSFQNPMFYSHLIQNNKWFSNTEFGVHAFNGEFTIRASLEAEKSATVIIPEKYSKEELYGHLDFFIFQGGHH